jgi:hypothetical protein
VSVTRWTRRSAIGVAVLGTAGLAVQRGRRVGRADEAGFLAKVLAYRAPYARLEALQRDRFVADYLQHERSRVRATLAALRAPVLYGRPGLDGLAAGAAGRPALAAFERHAVTAMLLSCGFFDDAPAGAGGSLVYRGWSPACANPFARRRVA